MSVFSFPNPVNEKAARVVAGLVVVSTLVILVSGQGWAWWLLAAGFGLRVAAGPRFSPFGILATRVIAPRLGAPTLVAGPPKRFAQAIGLTVSLAAAISAAFGAGTVALVLGLVLIVAAGLESIVGFCLGCAIFARLMAAGLIPAETCEACSNLSFPSASKS